MFKVGVVSKYYDKLSIAIVELDGAVAIGDKIKFVFEGKDLFEQIIETIQIGHQKTTSANRGEIVGLKVKDVVLEGAYIFKL